MLHFKFDYRSTPTLAAFAKDDTFIRGVMGPFGSGKSSACVAEILRRGCKQATHDGVRKSRWAVVRNSYPQLKDTTVKTFHQWLPPHKWGRWSASDHTYVINRIPGVEIEVLFRALDRPDQVANLLSLELTGAWLNEAREIDHAIFEAIQGRVRRYPPMDWGGPTWSGIIMDTNPPDDDSWWYELFEESKPPNARLFRQPGGRDPEAENLPHLAPNYYTDLAIGKTDEFVRVYIDAQYGATVDGLPVYRGTWSDSMHVAETSPIPGLPLIIGMDFGLTPSAAIAQITPIGQLRILDEIVTDDLGVKRFVDQALKPVLALRYPGYRVEVVGDPAGKQRAQTDEKTVFQIIQGAGFNIVAPYTNVVLHRLEAVRWFLTRIADGKPALVLDPKCRTLRKGFNGGYRFRRLAVSGPERYLSEPDKNRFSHVHDALQYLALHLRSGGGGQQDPIPPYDPPYFPDL